ncbi:MAG TPA: proprotein convertase P-domain protein, partial [Verrucomicrobiae bacterium]|nr:proprotein convertase P-domain protein [Verrucomicrobiae bacterium]
NGVIDPGETVTVNFALQNIGAAPTANLVATLLTNSGVHCVSGPQAYGALSPNGNPVSQPFTFTASGSCGGSISATLELQDGSTNLGTVSFDFGLGQFVSATTFSENFDEVTAPTLPPGWATNVSGADLPWTTDTNAYDSATNSVFVPDVAMPGTSQLISPSIPVASGTAQLSFMNYYDLEAYPSNSSSPSWAFDGGVLEISINGGAFQDILQAGGTFVSGGYVTNILDSSNPLNGRLAWAGNSGGFIPTIVNLPPAAAGQNIQLRWVLGTDEANDYGGTGWYIDSISIVDGYYSCCSSVVPLYIFNPQIIGTNIVFSFQTVCGQTYSVQSANGLANPNWTTFQTVSGDGSLVFITNSVTSPQRFYRIISP